MASDLSRTTEKQAKGILNGNLMRLVCSFDIETWEQVRGLARKRGTSVAHQVRQLVELGLETEALQ